MRKKKKLSTTLLAGIISIALLSGSQNALAEEASFMVTIRITGNDGSAQIILNDSQPAKELAAMLPLSLTFRDYAGEEKIADLPQKLSTMNGFAADEVEGDFAYYAPWGNLAVFYRDFGKGRSLYTLGKIESGKAWLAGQRKDFSARLEIVE